MAKILLVEDDNNLREIYGARLTAEGYQIVSAPDGEEALAIAVKEKPDLIITDIMMPKISGFDMLDILRNAPETKNTKIIMMTALSQTEDKERAGKLGADLYLVKSQVTLEDVAASVRKMLGENTPTEQTPASAAPAEAETPTQPPQQAAQPAPSQTTPVVAPEPVTSTPPEASPAPAATAPSAIEPPATSTPPPTPAPAEPTAQQQAAPSAQLPSSTTPTIPSTPIATPSVDGQSQPAGQTTTDNAQAQPASIQPPAPEPPTTDTPTAPTPPATLAIEEPTAAPVVEAQPAVVPKKIEVASPAENETTTSDPTATGAEPIGPTLAEALADEEQNIQEQIKNFEATPPKTTAKDQSADQSTPDVIKPISATPITEPVSNADSEKADSSTDSGSLTSVLNNETTPGKKVIQPIHDPTKGPDLDLLLAKEEEKEGLANIEPPTSEPSLPSPEGETTPEGEGNDNKPPATDDFSKISL